MVCAGKLADVVETADVAVEAVVDLQLMAWSPKSSTLTTELPWPPRGFLSFATVSQVSESVWNFMMLSKNLYGLSSVAVDPP